MKTTLTFQELHDQNEARCEEVFHPINNWSLTDWATALGGETGEALNVIKKLRRLDDADIKLRGTKYEVQLYDDLAYELADIVIYADLLATRAGINLGNAVKEKFNQVSLKRCSGRRL